MKKLSSIAALAALAAFAATPASAAQILLSASNIIGNLGSWSNGGNLVDQQTGAVSASQPDWAWSAGSAIVFDLGQATDIGKIEFFSKTLGTAKVTMGNSVGYNGWGSWLLNGQASELGSLSFVADGGAELSAQTLQLASTGGFRYLQINFIPLSTGGPPAYALNEIRIFDRNLSSAVPEPTTWAMMITGFGLAGAALRRRRGIALSIA